MLEIQCFHGVQFQAVYQNAYSEQVSCISSCISLEDWD
jgi:hypothetical protein